MAFISNERSSLEHTVRFSERHLRARMAASFFSTSDRIATMRGCVRQVLASMPASAPRTPPGVTARAHDSKARIMLGRTMRRIRPRLVLDGKRFATSDRASVRPRAPASCG